MDLSTKPFMNKDNCLPLKLSTKDSLIAPSLELAIH